MSVQVVPIIYDHASKQILRCYLLDRDAQLNDPAFQPQNNSERLIRIPLQLYQVLAGGDASRPLLYKLQDYVNGNAP